MLASSRAAALGGIAIWLLSVPAAAAPCAASLGRPLFGAGTAGHTALLSALAQQLLTLPQAERVQLFYYDAGVCQAVEHLAAPEGTLTFKTWNQGGLQETCEAPASELDFGWSALYFDPSFCEAELPSDFVARATHVEALALVAEASSTEEVISAEALYHVYGFGAGADGRSVAPWTNPAHIYGRSATSAWQLLLGAQIGLPATSFQFPAYNADELPAGGGSASLGFGSFAAAFAGTSAGDLKILAYRHRGQSCGYLPSSTPTSADQANVRSGQYPLWSAAQLFHRVDSSGRTVGHDGSLSPDLEAFQRRLDGTLTQPDEKASLDALIDAGLVPLCAMRVARSGSELGALASFAHPRPCGGYFDQLTNGATEQAECSASDHCELDEVCSYGYCEPGIEAEP